MEIKEGKVNPLIHGYIEILDDIHFMAPDSIEEFFEDQFTLAQVVEVVMETLETVFEKKELEEMVRCYFKFSCRGALEWGFQVLAKHKKTEREFNK